MESPSSKVEVIKQAIKQVMEEIRDGTKSSSDDGGDVEDDNQHRLLSKLMSQLERLEAEPEVNTEGSVLVDPALSKPESTIDNEANKTNIEEEKIVKELKKLKRQNLITHCLLSVMIVLTVAWQVSEVSIILKLKDGVNHPFRSIGNIFKWMLIPPKANDNEEETESSITNNLIESARIGDLKIPELPHIELPTNQLGF
ncbi:hypothetical protein L2E82_46321 [Cichorium intybus]|uniref:Uncharacterized protein n=1 Tax=Cichorium intybus TaxID=13427 RepID=A0ACB8YT97_CICIN|nr:hypothetical protein L2E82_46321 [Cichorium intybus]